LTRLISEIAQGFCNFAMKIGPADKLTVIKTVSEMRTAIGDARNKKYRIGFVPTMGALHQGHVRLIRSAADNSDFVVASIFVNPLQFGPNEDYEIYPRQLAEDLATIENLGVSLVFCPAVNEMFPDASSGHFIKTFISVLELEERLCGLTRVGHFKGMLTEVLKTFMIVQPDVAFFGEKDFQQLAIVRQAVRDLNIPIEIIGIPTVREKDGLACSSRNKLLTPQERLIAPLFHRTLLDSANAIAAKQSTIKETLETAKSQLLRNGFKIDYSCVIRDADLAEIDEWENGARIIAAVILGNVRLIDNVSI